MINDLKYALRMLVKTPAFTIIAVITLALGIGANSAIFSVVDTVLLRPLPFKNPNELVMIYGTIAREPEPRQTSSFPNFYDLRDQSQSFAAMGAYTGAGAVIREDVPSGALGVSKDEQRNIEGYAEEKAKRTDEVEPG